jgi:hypothetical protein
LRKKNQSARNRSVSVWQAKEAEGRSKGKTQEQAN